MLKALSDLTRTAPTLERVGEPIFKAPLRLGEGFGERSADLCIHGSDKLGGKLTNVKAEAATDCAKYLNVKAEVVTQKTEVTSEKAEVTSGKAEVTSGKAEVTSGKAEVTSGKAEVTSRNAKQRNLSVYEVFDHFCSW
ncbi:hypothetical protein LC605_01650 [Nostoc sp. CHAB 5836]|uniref:hypothetical protein n=1 Tax=Nostoc sp. CHAB 5836 TaxID=2780404 RepID=UPI001E4B183B|nr:hypothetical protein [Nostoc sp. CHAB 5836]MCC5613804.1 hypothetical protein [Nostoc sp. CHAB 5836]